MANGTSTSDGTTTQPPLPPIGGVTPDPPPPPRTSVTLPTQLTSLTTQPSPLPRTVTPLGQPQTKSPSPFYTDQPPPPLSTPGAIPVGESPLRTPLGFDPTGRNNPGNIKLVDGSGFQRFDTPQAGLQAIRQNLLAYQDQHKLNTVAGIINRWAPPFTIDPVTHQRKFENDTPTLIRNAAARMGVDPNAPLDLHDPAVMDKMVRAIVAQEQGDSVANRMSTLPRQQDPPPEEREPAQWGKPHPNWNLGGTDGAPQDFRIQPPTGIAGILQKFAIPLLAIASGGSAAGLALGITTYTAMNRAALNGQLLEYKINSQKWQTALREHQAQQQMESTDAGDAWAEFGGDDPSKPPADPAGLQQAMLGIADKYNDPQLRALAEAGDFDAIKRLQARRDMLNQPLMKMRLQQAQMELQQLKLQHEVEMDPLKKKELEDRIKLIEAETKKAEAAGTAAVNPYTTDGTGTAPETPATPSTADPTQTGDTGTSGTSDGVTGDTGDGTTGGDTGTPTDTGDTTTGAAAPTGPLTATAQAAPRRAQGLPPPTQLAAAGASDAANDPVRAAAQAAAQSQRPPQYQDPNAQPHYGPAMRRLNATGQDIARKFLEGDESLLRQVEQKFRAPILAGAAEMDNQLRAIPKDLTGQDVISAVTNIDPRLGTTLDRMLRNKAGVGSGRSTSTTSASFWDNMINLATQADPHWSPQQFATLQSVRKDFADGQQGKTLTRSFRLAQLAKQLWDDAGTMPSGPVPLNEVQRWFESGVAGNPKYTKFALDWHNFAIESQAVVTGGQPYASLSRIVLDTLERGATPAMIRQAIQSDLTASLGAIDATMSQWRQTFPEEGNPGSYNQRGYDLLWQIYHGDTQTGHMGDGLPRVGDKSDDGVTYLGGDPNDPLNRRQ